MYVPPSGREFPRLKADTLRSDRRKTTNLDPVLVRFEHGQNNLRSVNPTIDAHHPKPHTAGGASHKPFVGQAKCHRLERLSFELHTKYQTIPVGMSRVIL